MVATSKQIKIEKEKKKHALQVAEALTKQIKSGEATGVLSGITDNIIKFALKASEYIVQFQETMPIGNKNVPIKLLGGSAIPIYSITYKDVPVVFRVISEHDIDFPAYIRARKHNVLNKHFPEQYALEEFMHRSQKYYLEVVEYCGRQDLRVVNNDFVSRIQYVRNMLQIMADLRAAGFCFTDFKPGNFVIADDGRLVLSDVKSLRDVTGKDAIPVNELSNNISVGYQFLLDSVSNNPGSKPMVSIQEIEYESRYSLGISIYEVLTGHFIVSEHMKAQAAIKDLVNKSETDADERPFSSFLQQQATTGLGETLERMQKEDLSEHMNLEHEVFQSPVGFALKEIILSLTSKTKTQRMEAQEALTRLDLAIGFTQTSSAPSSTEDDQSVEASSSNSPGSVKTPESKKIVKQYSQAELPTMFKRASSAPAPEREAPGTPTVSDKVDKFKRSGSFLSKIFSSPKKEKAKPVMEAENPAP
ncbi:Protein kinase domain protein [Legionella steelei]|uniref:Protein kinase domain protein n=1 Tax=Legionella steelei TaxID=947033 RepID=A0A0W0ZQY5_9GAMM|nr:serine/threonine-protein kinase [Legionella steelei]KTD71442.1 Protein kinase domain protein [Legionella steelei]